MADTFPWPTQVDIVPVPAATATITLDELAALVTEIAVLEGGATSVDTVTYSLKAGTIGPAAPTAGTVQSTAIPDAPNNTLVFDSALPANSQVLVRYVRPGDMPAA